jgi:chemotaxis family two-component system response regulator Rcp1
VIQTIPPARLAEILLVDDNEDDIEFTRLAFEHVRLANRLHLATDGVEGLAFLRREGKYTGAVRPDLLLLDLNMPRMDGREMLSVMKSDEDLRRIPVVVLTTSDAELDIMRAYDKHANAYIAKPAEFSRFLEIVTRIAEHWFTLVKLPPR